MGLRPLRVADLERAGLAIAFDSSQGSRGPDTWGRLPVDPKPDALWHLRRYLATHEPCGRTVRCFC